MTKTFRVENFHCGLKSLQVALKVSTVAWKVSIVAWKVSRWPDSVSQSVSIVNNISSRASCDAKQPVFKNIFYFAF